LISEDFDSIRTSWFSYANIIGRKIQVQGEKTSFEGIVKDVDNSGCLIVDTDSGSVRVVSGDIIYL
jgi:biotin-(acetyl-CoA carboxylase) ligase